MAAVKTTGLEKLEKQHQNEAIRWSYTKFSACVAAGCSIDVDAPPPYSGQIDDIFPTHRCQALDRVLLDSKVPFNVAPDMMIPNSSYRHFVTRKVIENIKNKPKDGENLLVSSKLDDSPDDPKTPAAKYSSMVPNPTTKHELKERKLKMETALTARSSISYNEPCIRCGKVKLQEKSTNDQKLGKVKHRRNGVKTVPNLERSDGLEKPMAIQVKLNKSAIQNHDSNGFDEVTNSLRLLDDDDRRLLRLENAPILPEGPDFLLTLPVKSVHSNKSKPEVQPIKQNFNKSKRGSSGSLSSKSSSLVVLNSKRIDEIKAKLLERSKEFDKEGEGFNLTKKKVKKAPVVIEKRKLSAKLAKPFIKRMVVAPPPPPTAAGTTLVGSSDETEIWCGFNGEDGNDMAKTDFNTINKNRISDSARRLLLGLNTREATKTPPCSAKSNWKPVIKPKRTTLGIMCFR